MTYKALPPGHKRWWRPTKTTWWYYHVSNQISLPCCVGKQIKVFQVCQSHIYGCKVCRLCDVNDVIWDRSKRSSPGCMKWLICDVAELSTSAPLLTKDALRLSNVLQVLLCRKVKKSQKHCLEHIPTITISAGNHHKQGAGGFLWKILPVYREDHFSHFA